MSSTTVIKKVDKRGYSGLPPCRVPSAEAQLDELLQATGTRRLTTRIETHESSFNSGCDDGRQEPSPRTGKKVQWAV